MASSSAVTRRGGKDATDLAWAAGVKATGIVSGFMTSVILARILTTSDLGVWFEIRQISGIASAVLAVGVPASIVRAVALAPTEKRVVTRSFRIVGGVSAVAVSAAYATRGSPMMQSFVGGAGPYIGIVALVSAFAALERLGAEILRGQGNIKAASLGNQVASRGLLLAVLIAAVTLDLELSVARLVGLLLACLIATNVMNVARIQSYGLHRGPQVDAPTHGDLARKSFPLLLNHVSSAAVAGADLLVVAAVLGPEPAAVYGVALRVALLVGVPLSVVNSVAPHRVASMIDAEDRRPLQRWLARTCRLSGGASVLGFTALAVAGAPLLGATFGGGFRSAYGATVALAAGQVVNSLSGPASETLVNADRRVMSSVNSVAHGLALVGGCVIAARLTGSLLSVAIVAATVMASQNLTALVLVRWTTGLRTDSFVTRRALDKA
jgi:O-antigen/teichoic acid export membrane protein